MANNVPFSRNIVPHVNEYFRWSPEIAGGALAETVMTGALVVTWGGAAIPTASITVPADRNLVITNITMHGNPAAAVGGTAGIFRLRVGTTVAGNEEWRGDYNPSVAFGAPATGIHKGAAIPMYFGDNTLRIPASSVFCATIQRFTTVTGAIMHIVGYLERFVV